MLFGNEKGNCTVPWHALKNILLIVASLGYLTFTVQYDAF